MKLNVNGVDEFSELPTVLFEKDDPLYYNWCKEYFGAVSKNTNVRY